jgi:hypothetical protein
MDSSNMGKVPFRTLLVFFGFLLCTSLWGQVNLQFSKPITISGVVCGGINNNCAGSSYKTFDGDTVPSGKVWKIQFIGTGGNTSLCQRFQVNGAELNGWDTSNKQMWASPQPIWLNSGDYFLFYTAACSSFGTFTFSWVVNVLEFDKGTP